MRPRGFVVLGFFAAILLASPAGAAETDWDFLQFRIPDHRWYSTRLAGAFSASRSDLGTPGPESEQRRLLGDLQGAYLVARDGERLQNTFQFSAGLNARRTRFEAHDEIGGFPLFIEDRDKNETDDARSFAVLSDQVRWYPFAVPIGIATGLSGLAQYHHASALQQSVTTVTDTVATRRSENTFDGDLSTRDYSITWEITPLLGRVRDATAVYLGWLIEQRLRRDGLLAQPLSMAGRERLAHLLYVEYGYDIVHDFSDKFFWRDVERLLREDGALGEAGFDPYALLHAMEPAMPSLVQRRVGFAIGPTARLAYSDGWLERAEARRVVVEDTLQSSFDNHVESRVSDTDLLAGGVAEAHWPLGMRLQLDASVLAIFDTEDPHDRSQITTDGRLSWIVAERWLATAAFLYQRSRTEDSEIWATRGEARVDYFLEDHLTIGLGLNADQQEVHQTFADGEFFRFLQASLRIDYGFGGLVVPGLVEPVRPLAPGPGY